MRLHGVVGNSDNFISSTLLEKEKLSKPVRAPKSENLERKQSESDIKVFQVTRLRVVVWLARSQWTHSYIIHLET
jgi:hypothetical protein